MRLFYFLYIRPVVFQEIILFTLNLLLCPLLTSSIKGDITHIN